MLYIIIYKNTTHDDHTVKEWALTIEILQHNIFRSPFLEIKLNTQIQICIANCAFIHFYHS